MNSSRPLAKKIRKFAREQLRSSSSLWKQYKRQRDSTLSRLPRTIWLGLLAPAALLFFVAQRGPAALLLVLALYCAATVFGRAAQLSNALYRSAELAFFMHTPMPDREFFAWQWRRFLRSSLLVCFSSFLVFGYLAFTSHSGWRAWITALIAAVLQWLLVLTLILLLERFIPAWPKLKWGWTLYLLTCAIVFLPASLMPIAWNALLPLPTAWIPRAFADNLLSRDPGTQLLLVPALLLIALLPSAARRFRSAYPSSELIYPALIGVTITNDEADEPTPSSPAQESPSLDSHSFDMKLLSVDWNSSGWLERIASRLLTADEKRSAEFLCGGHPGSWSSQWLWAIRIAGVGVLTLIVPASLFTPLLSVVAGALACACALPLLGGNWPGTQPLYDSGRMRPAFSSVPLSYAQTSRVVAKINLLRYAVWCPFFLLYSTLLGWRIGSSPSLAFEIAACVLLVLISLQPILIVGLHSRNTNDTKSINPHSLLAVLVIGAVGLAFVACWILFFVALDWAPGSSRVIAAVLSSFGAFLLSVLIWRSYKLFYERGRVDTLRVP